MTTTTTPTKNNIEALLKMIPSDENYLTISYILMSIDGGSEILELWKEFSRTQCSDTTVKYEYWRLTKIYSKPKHLYAMDFVFGQILPKGHEPSMLDYLWYFLSKGYDDADKSEFTFQKLVEMAQKASPEEFMKTFI